MKWRPGGYTIVEVLIVLAVSGVLLATSISVFQGQQAETEFSQAVADLQSKFQSYGTQVASASIPSGYSCSSTYDSINNREKPYLTALTTQTTDSTSNQSCIYLGKALQIVPGGSTIYIYPVLGLRTIYNGSTDTGQFPSTPDQANPEAAQDGSGNFLLTDSYNLLNGTKVVSAKINNSENDFLVFYDNLQDTNTSGSEITAYSRAYTFAQSDIQSSIVQRCIEGGTCGGSATALGANSWKLCIQNDNGSRTAQLNLRNSATGFTTSTQDSCS